MYLERSKTGSAGRGITKCAREEGVNGIDYGFRA